MADLTDRVRDYRGRFRKPKSKRAKRSVIIDHNYASGFICQGRSCTKEGCPVEGKFHEKEHCPVGRRIVEFSVLLEALQDCEKCRLGPVPLTLYSIKGETKKGLGGYLKVQCQNPGCCHVNTVPYGKTYRDKKTGAPCFAVNTKLGTAMIDSVGGPTTVNNFLSTLNIPTIDSKNLKKMERRAGCSVESVASRSTLNAAKDAFALEMEDIAQEETKKSEEAMDILQPDLGISLLPDTSPNVKAIVESCAAEWKCKEDMELNSVTVIEKSKRKESAGLIVAGQKVSRARRRLLTKFPCKERHGMSCAVDTAWQKRGFDSLTSHTFFMSKAKYGKKVMKAIVKHRICGTCKWWRKNRPGQKVRAHRCVLNHFGSARLMESASGEAGILEMASQGTPVEYVEGDGDNTMISRLRTSQGIELKKRFDRNHIVKNIGKQLYNLQNLKLSKNVINHVQKCLKYAFAKNQGDPEGMKENLKAIVPHQFGDHTNCKERFCGYMKTNNEKYVHKSLPYKVPLKDPSGNLRRALDRVFEGVISNAEVYSDLGSSQQCEHANREVTLRAPKSLHYGNSESLDFRVQATAAFINEGRDYIVQAFIHC